METSNLTIIPPEGMEAYQEGNEIKFRPIKQEISYEDVSKKLFFEKDIYYITTDADILQTQLININFCKIPTNCSSEKQAQKLLAINKLMNTAKYLNGDWTPNWSNDSERKYYIYSDKGKYLTINYTYSCNYRLVYFKTYKLAEQAIKILGESVIKLALCTDW